MLSGLGNFVVHCSSVFANNIQKKQSNIKDKKVFTKEMILLCQLTRVVM